MNTFLTRNIVLGIALLCATSLSLAQINPFTGNSFFIIRNNTSEDLNISNSSTEFKLTDIKPKLFREKYIILKNSEAKIPLNSMLKFYRSRGSFNSNISGDLNIEGGIIYYPESGKIEAQITSLKGNVEIQPTKIEKGSDVNILLVINEDRTPILQIED